MYQRNECKTPLQIGIANSATREMEYILEVVLDDWLGLSYDIVRQDQDWLSIARNGRLLRIDSSFFRIVDRAWLCTESIPQLPLPKLNIRDLPRPIGRRLKPSWLSDHTHSIPILYGSVRATIGRGNGTVRLSDKPIVETDSNNVECKVDIFGSIFFMLSRYEEAVLPDRDEYDRFPSKASVAYRGGFLNRPIVNEYVELLWSMMSHLWPGLERKSREFRTLASHDVDSPFAWAGLTAKSALRRTMGDVMKRHSPARALRTWKAWYAVRGGDVSGDPYNTFDFIMRESEKRGLTSAFYFIADHTAGEIDGRYSLYDPEIVQLMREMWLRGHEIGLHTSFNTHRDCEQTVREAGRLRSAMDRNGLTQQLYGGRQHYLRWTTPQSFRNWDAANMQYDSTLSFADHAGFRCGTCWEYPVYDIVERRRLKLRERPLVAMEVSVIAEKYMAHGYSESAFEVFAGLKDICRAYNGDFTLLWHNTHLLKSEARELYLSVLDK